MCKSCAADLNASIAAVRDTARGLGEALGKLAKGGTATTGTPVAKTELERMILAKEAGKARGGSRRRRRSSSR